MGPARHVGRLVEDVVGVREPPGLEKRCTEPRQKRGARRVLWWEERGCPFEQRACGREIAAVKGAARGCLEPRRRLSPDGLRARTEEAELVPMASSMATTRCRVSTRTFQTEVTSTGPDGGARHDRP